MNPEYKNLTKIPYFRRVVLQNFPFIEDDFDALTDYGFLCKVVEYLNKVIEQQNLVNDNTNALYQSYIQLKNFVDNYFDNLDVQEEINNKLDAMAQDGTLQEIIVDYLNSKAVFGFDNVDSMKNATNLINGSYAKTLGYYDINDGGGAEYVIVNDNSLIDDGGSIHTLSNGLKAKLISENSITPQQFGAKGNEIDDDAIALQNSFRYASLNKISVQLKGKYYINQQITINSNLNLIINGSTGLIGQTISGNNNNFSNLIFSNYGSIKITGTTNVTFQNICFSGTNKALIIASFRNKIINCSFNGFVEAISTDSPLNWCGENQIMNCVFNSCVTCIKLDHGSDQDIYGNLSDGTCTNFIISNSDAGTKIQNNHDYSTFGSEIVGYNVTFVGNYIDGWNKLTIKGNSGFNISSNTFIGEAPESGTNFAIKFTNSSIASGLISSNTMCCNRNDLVNDYLFFINITDVTYFSYVTISSNNLRIAKNIFYGGTATKIGLCDIQNQCKINFNKTNEKATTVQTITNFNNIFSGYAKFSLDNITNSTIGNWDRVCNIWLHIIKMDNETEYHTEFGTSRNVVAKGDFSNATQLEVWSFGIKDLNNIPLLYSDN